MLVLLLSLVVLSAHGMKADQDYETLRKQVETLTEVVAKMQIKVSDLELENQELRRSELDKPPICFSAVKTSIQVAEAGDNILFNEELVDTHDSYNPKYGTYVVPQAGLYEVIVTLFKTDGSAYNNVYGRLYVGNTRLTQIYISTANANDYDYGTSTIIGEFQPGDVLRVEATFSGSYFGSVISRASQFSAKYLGPAK